MFILICVFNIYRVIFNQFLLKFKKAVKNKSSFEQDPTCKEFGLNLLFWQFVLIFLKDKILLLGFNVKSLNYLHYSKIALNKTHHKIYQNI